MVVNELFGSPNIINLKFPDIEKILFPIRKRAGINPAPTGNNENCKVDRLALLNDGCTEINVHIHAPKSGKVYPRPTQVNGIDRRVIFSYKSGYQREKLFPEISHFPLAYSIAVRVCKA